MHWLIIEDALKNKKGHWFEYLNTFWVELQQIGDKVEVLADNSAEPHILRHFQAHPILPNSIWHRMGDSASALQRYTRIPTHALKTYTVLSKWLKDHKSPDVLFVPTVLVHHLLAWFCLIKGPLNQSKAKVLLFFPNLPINLTNNQISSWDNSLTSKLLHFLLRWLRREITSGSVILGVETLPMKKALENIIQLPVTYFPHPILPLHQRSDSLKKSGEILMACYGAARYEKGSNILQEAILAYLKRFPNSRAKFAIQWVDDFLDEKGETVCLAPDLKNHEKVTIVSRYFEEGEYLAHLNNTDVLLLPYRRSSYKLRVSRVAAEAFINGIPVMVTSETTLADQSNKYGAAVLCDDGDTESIIASIRHIEENFDHLSKIAKERAIVAQQHFSVSKFRAILSHTA